MASSVRTEMVAAVEQAETETAGETTVTALGGMWLLKGDFSCVNWSTLVLSENTFLSGQRS